MNRLRPLRAPLWFHVCVAVAIGVSLRWLWPGAGPAPARGGDAPAVHYAFWVILALIGELIWKGLEAAGRITLAVLAWSVQALWAFAGTIANAAKEIGHGLMIGVRAVWDFAKLTYNDVLKPFAQTMWRWINKARQWLEKTFGPLLKHLRDLRDSLLCFWKTYVRPWLDLIDITRKVLRVGAALGLSWARALDQQLGAIEDAIEKPFRFVLGKLNEIIDIVNRVITADGLFQRLALIRSLERDYIFAWRAAVNPWVSSVTDSDQRAIAEKLKPKTLAAITNDTAAYMRDKSGPSAPLLSEMTIIWRNYLVRR